MQPKQLRDASVALEDAQQNMQSQLPIPSVPVEDFALISSWPGAPCPLPPAPCRAPGLAARAFLLPEWDTRMVRRLSCSLLGSVIAASVLVGGGNWASAATSGSAVKHAALTYASATLSGPFKSLESVLSPECRTSDHVTSEALPLARSLWGSLMGVPLARIRATGVKVRELTATSAQAEVEYNTAKAGNSNWVTYVLDKGHWLVGGQCATPMGNFESSTSMSGSGLSGSSLNSFLDQDQQFNMKALQKEMAQQGIANSAAASAASAAEHLAVRNDVPVQALSTSYLDAHLPTVAWVDASTQTPYTPDGRRIVGISVNDGHIVTSVQPYQGECNFGLVVTSPSDPIIEADHLGGPGTFGSNVGSATPHCGFMSAPTSWLPVKPLPLSSLADLQRPPGGCRTSKTHDSVTVTCPIRGEG